jgi:hypothetical protein
MLGRIGAVLMLASNLLLVLHDIAPHHHHDGFSHHHEQGANSGDHEEIGANDDQQHSVSAHPEDPLQRQTRHYQLLDAQAVEPMAAITTEFTRPCVHTCTVAFVEHAIHGPPRPSVPRSPPF